MQSVLKNEDALCQLQQRHDKELSAEIRAIICNRQFRADCEHVVTVCRPLMTIIPRLESNTATLADCYQQMIALAAVIEGTVAGLFDFRQHCLAAFCRRWTDLQDDVYMLAYFLHPGMDCIQACLIY
jgi:hypothetical protein